jgi:hypothetical protein
VAVKLGTDRVTFDYTRPSVVWVNGSPLALQGGQFIHLNGGTVYNLGGNYRVVYDTGEQVQIGNQSVTVNLGANNDGPVSGILGNADGNSANDLALPDGTVLTQPLTFDQLYTTFADAWRVTQANSLFDYAPGQTTATFTNLAFPPAPITVADLPTTVVQQAQDAIAGLGITDAQQEQNAILDYVLSGGDTSGAAGDAAAADQGQIATDSVTPTQAPVVNYLGVTAPSGATGVGGTAANVVFQLYRTGDVSAPLTVTYAVVDPHSGNSVGASDYGGTLPSGSVTFAAGSDTATITVPTPASLTLPTESLELRIGTTATNISFSNTTATAVLASTVPVEGADAVPVFYLASDFGTLTETDGSYTLDLGTIGAYGVAAEQIWLTNQSPTYGDTLGGTFGAPTGSGFDLSAASAIAIGGQGQGSAAAVGVVTTSLGAHSETFVFHPTETNASGFSATLPDITLTVTDTIVPSTATPTAVPTVLDLVGRTGGGFDAGLTVGNAAVPGTDKLGVTVTDTGGHILLAQTEPLTEGTSTTLTLGNLVANAGTFQDTLGIAYSSIAPGGTSHALPGTTVTVDGTVYQAAIGALGETIVNFGTVHQGAADPTATITVENTATAGSLSDDLIATLGPVGVFGPTTSGGTVTIGAGESGDLTATLSTAQGGSFSSTGTISYTSHDGAQADASAGIGTVTFEGVVIANAVAGFEQLSGPGTITGSGNSYVLDLGRLPKDLGAETITIAAVNEASGLADTLSGSLTLSTGSNSTGLGSFSGLGAGEASGGYTVTIDTNDPASLNATITLDAVDDDTGVTTPVTLTLEGSVACFATGTRIATLRGAVAVEALAVGDIVTTASGGERPIRWLGHRRLDPSRHADPTSVYPVLVQRGAFGAGSPVRDLWLSPDHAVVVGEALTPIRTLLNGSSVVQVTCSSVEYWHVELDAHDVLLAEGLAAESYLDTGNRGCFANGGGFIEAHPDFSPRHWAETCLPLIFDGPEIDRMRRRLLDRATMLGHSVTSEPDMHVMADGRRIDPTRLDAMRFAFLVPPGSRTILLRSRSFVPAHTRAPSTDQRSLGLCVKDLSIDGMTIALDDEAHFTDGWHRLERGLGYPEQRWTCGAATLPAGSRTILVDLAGDGYYWAEMEVGRRTTLLA